jgi:tetratricopeptide (TPR) repeat protein
MRYLHSVRPRWGGSVEQMEAQVREADSAAARWPRLRLLHGWVAYDDASALYDKGDYAGAVRRFAEALRYGDTWQYRADRANAYFHTRQYQDAIGDYGAALAERPGMVDALAWRAAAFDYLAWDGSHDDHRDSLFTLGRRDIDVAMALDSTNASLVRVLKGHPTLQPRQAP